MYALKLTRARHEGIECRPELRTIAILFLQDFVPGTLDHAMRSRGQARGKSLDRRIRHDGVAARRQHQDRLIDLQRVIRGAKRHYRIERRIQPCHRRRTNCNRWILSDIAALRA